MPTSVRGAPVTRSAPPEPYEYRNIVALELQVRLHARVMRWTLLTGTPKNFVNPPDLPQPLTE